MNVNFWQYYKFTFHDSLNVVKEPFVLEIAFPKIYTHEVSVQYEQIHGRLKLSYFLTVSHIENT